MSTTAPVLFTYPKAPKATAAIVTPTTTSSCSCTNTATLTEERGATLSTKMTLTTTDYSVTPPVTTPIDITGASLQFTAKIDATYADDDPSTVKVDWQETSTPTEGITHLVIPAEVTITMQPVVYLFQVRMVSAGGLVTPLCTGTLTIIEPISARS
jgi:hypothetical protein